MRSTLFPLALGALLVAGCKKSDDSDPPTEADTDTDTDSDTDADTDSDTDSDEAIVPTADLYTFPGRDDATLNTVAYDGQVFRQLLIEDLKSHIGGLTTRLNGTFVPADGDVLAELEFYLDFDGSTSGTLEHGYATTPAALQTVYDDVSSGKMLTDKIAGNDPVGQHKDWTTEFVGWTEAGVTTPESLARLWMGQIDDASVAWSAGTYPLDPSGAPVASVFITAQGQDLQQLLQKFLGGAVSLSQGADDYLDDDEPGQGLLSDHTSVTASGWTELEHQWDEAFGYFGAPRDYSTWTDAEIANSVWLDRDGDGAIDLLSEVSWGHSGNAAKRDNGAAAAAPTDFTADAWAGFWGGRELLASTSGALTPAELDGLRGFRDQALDAWEGAIAATMVHYINDTIRDTNAIGTPAYSFTDHAKHWSELKGFALSTQFNPHSPMSDADFVTMHTLLRQAPELSADAAARQEYIDDLIAARTLIGTAYGFDAANLGDANGENGW